MNIKQQFFENYCFALTATHNYVVSEHLLKEYSLSWGIVSGYYTLMTVARMCCNIGTNDYPEYHNVIVELLHRERDYFKGYKSQRKISHTEVITNLNNYIDDIEEKLYNLGGDLCKLKSIRNDSNYEHFIIPHQFYHKEMRKPLESFISRLRKTTAKWLNFGIEFFLNYVNKLDVFPRCLGVILDKHVSREGITIWNESYFWGYEKYLDDLSNNRAKKDTITKTKEVWNKSIQQYSLKAIPVEESFYLEMTIDKYDQKKKIIREFTEKLNEFHIS